MRKIVMFEQLHAARVPCAETAVFADRLEELCRVPYRDTCDPTEPSGDAPDTCAVGWVETWGCGDADGTESKHSIPDADGGLSTLGQTCPKDGDGDGESDGGRLLAVVHRKKSYGFGYGTGEADGYDALIDGTGHMQCSPPEYYLPSDPVLSTGCGSSMYSAIPLAEEEEEEVLL